MPPPSARRAPFEGWAKLDLVGRRELVGYVRDVDHFGARMCQIEVLNPGGELEPAECYAGRSIFKFTPLPSESAALEFVVKKELKRLAKAAETDTAPAPCPDGFEQGPADATYDAKGGADD